MSIDSTQNAATAGGPLHQLDPRTPPVAPRGRVLLWYVLGGRIDRRHSTWVLRDLTCGTWWLRHFARHSLVILPLLGLYLLLMPAGWGVVLVSGLTFAAGLYLFSLVNILIDTDRRAVRAGYPSGYVSDLRERRSQDRHRAASHRRRERIAARRSRRR